MPDANGNSPERLDRIERIVEILANTTADLQQDMKIVLRAQVLMSDSLEKLTVVVKEGFAQLTEAQRRTEESLRHTQESLRHTDERMDALILIVDQIIRGKKT
jgi:hypothetical protein